MYRLCLIVVVVVVGVRFGCEKKEKDGEKTKTNRCFSMALSKKGLNTHRETDIDTEMHTQTHII